MANYFPSLRANVRASENACDGCAKFVEPDEMFLANYSDAVTDLDLGAYVDAFKARKKVACFLSVRVPQTFHIVRADAESHHGGARVRR